jgi:hypothetical protein
MAGDWEHTEDNIKQHRRRNDEENSMAHKTTPTLPQVPPTQPSPGVL